MIIGKSITNILKTVILLTVFVFIAMSMSAKTKHSNSFKTPDFAYPETVNRNARAEFDRAASAGNHADQLTAAMQIVISDALRDFASGAKSALWLDSVATTVPAPWSSLYRLLEANIYSDMYERNSYKYDNRTLPVDSFPGNPADWSRDLFALKVTGLVENAVSEMGKSGDLPLRDISDVLDRTKDAEALNFTVGDFVRFKGVELLSTFCGSYAGNTIPFGMPAAVAESPAEKATVLRTNILDDLCQGKSSDSPDGVAVLAIRMKADGMSENERACFLYDAIKRGNDSNWLSPLYADLYDAEYSGFPDDRMGNHRGMDYGYENECLPGIAEFYNLAKSYLASHPKAWQKNAVTNIIRQMGLETAQVEVASQFLVGSDITGNVIFSNSKRVVLSLYHIAETLESSVSIDKVLAAGKRVEMMVVETSADLPFVDRGKFTFKSPGKGRYVIVASEKALTPADAKNYKNHWTQTVLVSDLAILTSTDTRKGDDNRVYVVSGKDMAPVSGATVILYTNDRGKYVEKKRLTTGMEGYVTIPKGYYLVKAEKDGDVAIANCNANTYSSGVKSDETLASILPDLAVYRPGDTVNFAVVVYNRHGNNFNIASGRKIEVQLFNANREKVDSVMLTTDDYGRCSGSLKVTENGLLGNWMLVASNGKEVLGREYLNVAEYKAPTFFVEFAKDDGDRSIPQDTVVLRGKVKTYSGMPVSGASVSYTINWSRWRGWWNGGGNATYGGKVSADEQGDFAIVLPTSRLKGTRYEKGCFSVNVEATSPAGETQSASTAFALGKGMRIGSFIPSQLEVKGDSVCFNVELLDMLGEKVNGKINYKVINESSSAVVEEGVFDTPVLSLLSSKLPSACYKFVLTSEMADSVTSECVLFRADDRNVPYPVPAWTPVSKVVAPAGAEYLEIPAGSFYGGSKLLCEVMSGNGFVDRQWIDIPAQGDDMVKIKVKSPSDTAKIWVNITGIHNLESASRRVEVVPAIMTRKLNVTVKSFRDRLMPNSKEKWSFAFTVTGDAEVAKGVEVPAIAVMYDHALDAIAPFSWDFNPRSSVWFPNFCDSRITGVHPFTEYYRLSPLNLLRTKTFTYPAWNYYGYSLLGWETVKNQVYYSSASADGAVEVLASVRPTARMMKSSEIGNAGYPEMEEAAVTEGVNDMAADTDGGAPSKKQELRPVEMPLAFFRPLLRSDRDGNLEVEFEVPDFNTTWCFRLAGYDASMLTTELNLEAVASKPVMVQTNLPRFVRTGDKVEFLATFFNNSTEPRDISGRIELFNPVDGRVLDSRAYSAETILPSRSRVVEMDWNVPADIASVGVRVTAEGGGFSDGEQTALPVLPSSTPVVESTTFYMPVGNAEKTIKLPEFDKNANVTFKYCDNPVWECVLALSSISKPNSVNIFSLMKALYSNCITSGLMKSYPRIGEALTSLATADSGKELLTSPLQRDSALKTVALQNTPWVNDAVADTQRMISLTQLSDTARMSDAITSVMRRVIALQHADGGWSWCPDMPSSVFATSGVLLHLGMLKSMGYMPENAKPLIYRAVAFCDDNLYESYLKSDRKFSTTSMINYLYIRSFFDVKAKSGFMALKKEALDAICKNWRKEGIYEKATAAILLHREQRGKTASEILSSLDEFVMKDSEHGWWFENVSSGFTGWPKLITMAQALEAYSEIEPESAAVDGLRQWLVLQKMTENWGADNYTTEVVQAILSSGTDWTSATDKPQIKLGGKKLTPDQLPLTGEITLDLSPQEASGKKLEIKKRSDGPSWGGVIAQVVQPIKDVKAAEIPDLSISKALYKITATDKGLVAERGVLKQGDKVRVTLTIDCGKDMEYVAVTDGRAACLEPADQLSSYTAVDGVWMYREVRDDATNLFIPFLSKGQHVISYDCYVTRDGEYASGIATVQCQYAPLMTAHSAGDAID